MSKRSLARPGVVASVMLGFMVSASTGCPKFRSGTAGTDAPAAADSSKHKHLHLGGGGGRKAQPPGSQNGPAVREPSEAATSRHTRHAMTPLFHWDDGGAPRSRHKGRSGL